MAQNYKVTQVVERDEWGNEYGKYQTYAVKFEGSDEWIKWNKKFKDGRVEAPKVGDEVYGKIDNGKFNLERKDGGFAVGTTRGGGGNFTSRPDHHEEIKAQWAIGQAIAWLHPTDKTSDESIESTAKRLYAMVDRVKGDTSGYEKARQVRARLDKVAEVDPEEEVTEDSFELGDEPIDLKDIPF